MLIDILPVTFGPTTPPATPAPLILPTTAKSAAVAAKSGSLKTAVYFDMNGSKLDKADMKILRDVVTQVKSAMTATTKVSMTVVGWVQPTKISPNVSALSKARAMAAVSYIKTLGIKASMKIMAPGEGKVNKAGTRAATVEINWVDKG